MVACGCCPHPPRAEQLLAKDSHCSGNCASAGVHDWRASGRRQVLGLELTYQMGVSQVEERRGVLWVEGAAWAKGWSLGAVKRDWETGETASRPEQGWSSSS